MTDEVRKDLWVVYVTTRKRLKVAFETPLTQEEAEQAVHFGDWVDIIDEEDIGEYEGIEAEEE